MIEIGHLRIGVRRTAITRPLGDEWQTPQVPESSVHEHCAGLTNLCSFPGRCGTLVGQDAS
jgi:hypothetical protein